MRTETETIEAIAIVLQVAPLNSENLGKINWMIDIIKNNPMLTVAANPTHLLFRQIAAFLRCNHYLRPPEVSKKTAWKIKDIPSFLSEEKKEAYVQERLNKIREGFELQEKQHLEEVQIVTEAYQNVKLLLDPLSVLPPILLKKIRGGFIVPSVTDYWRCTVDLRCTPYYGRGLLLSSKCCIYNLKIGDYLYIGSTKSSCTRLYYHHQKIHNQLFGEEMWLTYKNLEDAVLGYGFTMKFEIIKEVEYRWDLKKEEQDVLDKFRGYPKLLNSIMTAYRDEG